MVFRLVGKNFVLARDGDFLEFGLSWNWVMILLG